MEKINKQKAIQYLTDLMATIQAAYFKSGAAIPLLIHETGEAGIYINIFRPKGGGMSTNEGFTSRSNDNPKLERAFRLVYNPDYEEDPLWITCYDGDLDKDYDKLPEDLSEAVLTNIATWLEQAMQPMPQEEKKIMALCSYDEDERDHGVLLAVSRKKFKNDPAAVRKAIREMFTPGTDDDEQELKECIDDLMQEQSGYYGIEYYWKELPVLL